MKAQYYEPAYDLYYQYDNYRDSSFTGRRFSYHTVAKSVTKYHNAAVDTLGTSIDGKNIYGIKLGSGPLKVFMWSQMHGDEPTATMALFDLLNFLTANDNMNETRSHILNSITLFIIPLLNPDGMEKYKRRSAVDIDINRDALRLVNPESQILMNNFKAFAPDVSFNLHDQLPRYTVGITHRSALLALLAPAFNYEKELSPNRTRAMQVCAHISNVLSAYIPGHIARYTDEFEPRAFGDNLQKLGSSTVLIESGGWKNDPEKQYIRKMNFLAYVSALSALADDRISKIPLNYYDQIPYNEKYLYDVLLRELTITRNDKDYLIDVGINLNEIPAAGHTGFRVASTVEDAGDLSTFYGNRDHILNGYRIEPGKVYPKTFDSIDQLGNIDFDSLYGKGYIYVMANDAGSFGRQNDYPIIVTVPDFDKKERKNYLTIGNAANFIITKDGKTRFVVINGFLYDTELKAGYIKNGLIIR